MAMVGAPVALTSSCVQAAREVELQRALVAEAAMKSGPAIASHDILFEDEWLLLVNKPSGFYSGHVLASAPSVMRSSTDFAQLHLANRLDRDTSGVLVISKSREVSGMLGQLFTKRKIGKTYIGLCYGFLPQWSAVTVTSGHGRSEFGVYNVFQVHDIGKKLVGRGGSVVKEMTTRFFISTATSEERGCDTACARPGEQGTSPLSQVSKQEGSQEMEWQETNLTSAKPKESDFRQGYNHPDREVVVSGLRNSHRLLRSDEERCPAASNAVVGGSTSFLLTAIPLTGRTHQIRLQCLYLGIPLVGDVKYGGPRSIDGIVHDAHCLHARSLSFKHPVTLVDLHVVAPLPLWASAASSNEITTSMVSH